VTGDIAQALADARALAESLMLSTAEVFTPGEPTTDPDTGEVTATETPVHSGPCRFRPAGPNATATTGGGAEVFTFDYVVSFPFSVTTLREGQRVRCLTSPDPALPGVVVEIQRVARGDVSARRLFCGEVA
jgi:hypothetical protein